MTRRRILGSVNLVEPMVTAVPSPWLSMQEGLRSFSRTLIVLELGVLLLAILSIYSLLFGGVVDLTWIFLLALVWALNSLRRFCEGTVDRIRHLSELA